MSTILTGVQLGQEFSLVPPDVQTSAAAPSAEARRVLTEIVTACQADYGRLILSLGVEHPQLFISCLAGEPVAPILEGHWIEERALIQRSGVLVTANSPLPYFAEQLGLAPVTQLMAVPIIRDDIAIGVLSVGYTHPLPLVQEDLNDLTAICDYLAPQLPPAAALVLSSSAAVDLSSLYAHMPWAIMLIDETEHVLCANSQCAALLRRDAEQLPGLALHDLLVAGEDELPRASGEIASVVCPDGTRFLVETTNTQVVLDDGHRITMVILRDMSQEQILFAERLRSAEFDGVSRTIATVNHEINNPLFGLIATMQLLRGELHDAPPSVDKKLQRIGECCERIQQIVDKLSQVMQPARRTYAANEGMLDLARATGKSQ
ncbi:MAG TPA: histidine kinase dimerization/phospho-acceptor domain-containing protein [Armatimonadota bacterium]